MPLGDTQALRAWGERDNPPYRLWRRVELWILGLDNTPWQAPSVPLTFNVGDPLEIRYAELPEANGVKVFYEHEHRTGLVNLLHVGH